MHLRHLHTSLRMRIILWSLAPMMLILSVVGVFVFTTYWRVTESLVMDRNRDLTRLLASQFSVELVRYADQLEELGSMMLSASRTARQGLLDTATAQLSDFGAGVVVVDRDGLVVAATRGRSELVGQNWASRGYFRRIALDRHRVLLSDIQNDGPMGSQVVAVAIPLLSPGGRLEGLLVGMFNVGPLGASNLSRSLLRLDLRPETRVALVDSEGRAIYHHDAHLLGSGISGQPAVQAARAGQVGALRSRDVEGNEIIVSYAPVPGTLCGLIEEESWAELRQVSAGYGRTLLALLALGIVLPVTVVAWALGRTTRPIKRVTQAVRAMAMGDLSQRITPPREDELGELARAFNHMCSELQLMYTDLEGQVEVRTRHLATINAVAAVTSRSLDLAEILHAALGTVLGTMGFEAGVAYRLFSDEGELLLISSRGLSDESAHKVRRVRLEALASKAQLSKGPLVRLVADYPPQEFRETLQQEGWRMAISVPLLAKGELLGVMNLRALTPRLVTPEEVTLLAAIGEQVGVALENALLYERAGEVAVAAERNRLGQELHDSISQALFSAHLLAGVIPILLEQNPEGAKDRLAELSRLTRGALAEMRALLFELRPAALARMSLPELLRQLAEVITNSAPVPVHLTLDEAPDIPARVRIGLYRIAQEALNNVVKHAQASQVWVEMHAHAGQGSQATITLRVRDQGRGFDLARVSGECLGLGIMQERAREIGATLEIESQPGAGTQVTVVWQGHIEAHGNGPPWPPSSAGAEEEA